MRGISWLAKPLLGSEKRLYTVELAINIVTILQISFRFELREIYASRDTAYRVQA
jgi:hypothetical protein